VTKALAAALEFDRQMRGPYDFAGFDENAARNDLLPGGLAAGFFVD